MTSTPTSSYDDVSFSGDFSIRALKSSDIPRVSELHAELLQYRYPASFFRQFLIHSSRICLVASPLSDPDNIVAFVSASVQTLTIDISLNRKSATQDPQVEILTLGVIPEYRRRGVGRRLLLTSVYKLQESAKYSLGAAPAKIASSSGTKVTAQVAAFNDGGKDFYGALGMQNDGDVVSDMYRSLSSRYKDGFVVAGRVH